MFFVAVLHLYPDTCLMNACKKMMLKMLLVMLMMMSVMHLPQHRRRDAAANMAITADLRTTLLSCVLSRLAGNDGLGYTLDLVGISSSE